MKTDAKPQLETLLQAVARAPRSLLMLDYDGTIAPFHKNRDQALPYEGVSELIHDIVSTGKTRIVIISGRDGNEIIPLLKLHPHPEIWGLHGLQRLKSDGSAELASLDATTSEALAAAENWLQYQHLKPRAEVKAGSIAVHWRGLSENDAEALREMVLTGWKPIAKYTRLQVMEFDGGIEIRASKTNKGDVVSTLLSEMDPAVPAAYLGDDNSDELAFQAIKGRGLSVLVRPRYRATAAKVWLEPPDEVIELLEQWLSACRERNQSNNKKSWAVNA